MIDRSRTLTGLLACAVAIASCPLAFAQPVMTAAERKESARTLTAEGLGALEAGDGARALTLFEQAYALIPHPQLIYNLGRASELAGDEQAAISRFEQFVAVAPRDPYARDASDRLPRLRKQLASKQAAAALEAERAAAEEREAKAARAAEAARRAAAERDDRADLEERDDRDRADERRDGGGGLGAGLKLGGVAVGVAGLAALGMGTYHGVRSYRLARELEDQYSTARAAEHETARGKVTPYAIAGGALVVTGGLLYYLGHRRSRPRSEVAMLPIAGGAELVWGGAF